MNKKGMAVASGGPIAEVAKILAAGILRLRWRLINECGSGVTAFDRKSGNGGTR